MEAKVNLEENEQLFEIHDDENSPFRILERDGKYNVILGNCIAHPQTFDTLEEAQQAIERKDWNLVWTLIYQVASHIVETKNKK